MARTSAQVMEAARKQLASSSQQKELLRSRYANEDKVAMYLSPMYRPYFGRVMRVSINGVSIYFKVDGSTQLIPTTFADEVTRRRMAIDAMLTKQGRMADVAGNHEASPGELKIF